MAAFRDGGRDAVTHSKGFKDIQSYSKVFRKKMMRHPNETQSAGHA
jgi:hypothetical protein